MGIMKQERHLTLIRRQLEDQDHQLTKSDLCPSGVEALPELHHVMSSRSGYAINLAHFLRDHWGDPAIKVRL